MQEKVEILAYQQTWNVERRRSCESMPPPSDRWRHCSPVPAHMCKDGRPRDRPLGAFAHVRISLSRQRCARLTRPSCGIGPGGRAPFEEDSRNEAQQRSRKTVSKPRRGASHIFPRLERDTRATTSPGHTLVRLPRSCSFNGDGEEETRHPCVSNNGICAANPEATLDISGTR